jgi:CubicO group peptidase (beta-lactamase class C family)
VSPDFEHTIDRLERDVAEGLFTRGAQVAVSVNGEQALNIALGETGTRAPMTTGTISRVWCTIKPVLAVAIGRAADEGLVDLDEPLESRMASVRSLRGGVTAAHILTHTAGLHLANGVQMEMIPPDQRREAIENMPRPPGWRVGTDAAYSEYAGWNVLGWLLEQVTGEELRPYLRRTLLEPLGLHDTWIGMTAADYRDVLPRLGVNLDLRDVRAFPLIIERSERVCTETNPAHGGYTTAADLSCFYAAMLDRLAGRGSDELPSPATLARFCSPARPEVFDEILDRTCSYGLGFMTTLADHAFGPICSPRSFGHSGNVGSSFAFADPAHGLAVAAIFNGIVDPESAFLRRPVLVRALYRDLGLDTPPSDAPPRRRRRLLTRHRPPAGS